MTSLVVRVRYFCRLRLQDRWGISRELGRLPGAVRRNVIEAASTKVALPRNELDA
jgi:hypothetical protein